MQDDVEENLKGIVRVRERSKAVTARLYGEL